MSAPSPRPTREQVDEVLPHSSTTYAETVLAAEVRALRADLDTAQEAHAADTDELERLRTPQPAEDLTEVLLAEVALAAGYKGQPSRGLVEHVAALHSAALAPQPAVPDGPHLDALHRALARRIGNLRKGSRKLLEISSARNANHRAVLDERDQLRDELDEARRIGADVARQRAELLLRIERSAPAAPDSLGVLRRELWAVLDLDPGSDRDLVETVRPICGRTAALVLDAHGHFGPDVEAEDEVVCDVSHWRLSWAAEKAAGGRPDTRSSLPVVDGEDVPARLEAAADALRAMAAHGLSTLFRQFASALRGATDEHRAAVAAALARPTGHQQ